MLRLKVVSPDSTKSLSVSNEINFKQLKGVIVESFQDQSIKEEDFDILYGFPPEVCTLSDDQLICPTLNSGMTLRMVIKTSTCTSSLSTSSQVPLNNVHKRKASKTTDTLQGTKKQISILRNLDASSKTFSVSVKSAPTPIKNKPRVRKMKSSDHASSENDIIEHLIEALNGGKGNRNKILRKAFRNAVSLQYNSSKAVARLSSLYAGKYSIKESQEVRLLGTGEATKIEVTFHKGAGSAKNSSFVETVDLLPVGLLRDVIRVALQSDDARQTANIGDVQGREVLKPMNLSKCSPRIFWSLVHRYGPNIHQSIREALRGLDDQCEWLEERKRELSEKAQQNLQQKQELAAAASARKRGKKGKGGEVAAAEEEEKKAEVAVEVVGETTSSTSRDASGNNTLTGQAEQLASQYIKDLVEAIPIDDDLLPIEWREAVFAAIDILYGSSSSSSSGSINSSSSSSGVRSDNKGAIALAWLDYTPETRNLIAEMKLATAPASVSENSSCSSSSSSSNYQGSSKSGMQMLSIDQIEFWVASAQLKIVNAVWRVICGGGSERLRRALEKTHIRTPRELTMWRSAKEELVEATLPLLGPSTGKKAFTWPQFRQGGAGEVETAEWDVSTVEAMCLLSQKFMELYSWAGLFKFVESHPDEKVEEEEEQEQEQEQEEEEGWLYEKEDNSFLGRRVCLTNTLEVDREGFWEEGTVMGFLPATDEEPMALWKVQLDDYVGEDSKHRKADLEEFELLEAIERMEKNM